MKKIFLVAIGLILLMAACKKDDTQALSPVDSKDVPLRLQTIKLVDTSFLTIKANTQHQLLLKMMPEGANLDTTLTYISSHPEFVTINANGMLTAIKPGRSTITIKNSTNDVTKTLTVAVINADITAINVVSPQVTAYVGGTATIDVTVAPTYASTVDLNFISSNTNIATVSATGVVTGISAGTATITIARLDGKVTATCTVTVKNVNVTGITIQPSTITLAPGSSYQFTSTLSPTNATNKNVSWTSSNPGVASVSSTGLITAVGTGSTVIKVTSEDGGYSATCNVTVASISSLVTGIATYSLRSGNTENVAVALINYNPSFNLYVTQTIVYDTNGNAYSASTTPNTIAAANFLGAVTKVMDLGKIPLASGSTSVQPVLTEIYFTMTGVNYKMSVTSGKYTIEQL